MQRRQHWASISLLLLASAVAFAGEPSVEPLIPPGYIPQPQSRDERGLWMEMSEFEESLKRSPLLVRDPALCDYVRGLMCRIAGEYCPDIRVYVIRNPAFNAFMTPNGMLVLWTGVLTRVRSESELALIIGHELAHYLRTHSLLGWRKARRGLATGSILSLGLFAATGVLLPVGESLALLSSMAFSREQESEADLFGTRLLAEAGFDPHGSYAIWGALVAEENRAAAKREEPGLFTRTHPDPGIRAIELRRFVLQRYSTPTESVDSTQGYVAALGEHYEVFMEDQLDTNRYGRTEFLLERHVEMGIDPGLVEFFRGEMYRQRGDEGDMERARQAYLCAIHESSPHPEAYRNLGYIALKGNDPTSAAEYFRHYLTLRPEASDREMIEYYLEDTP